ncbi:hypothetical protein YC2023_095555 [Brassica napus]
MYVKEHYLIIIGGLTQKRVKDIRELKAHLEVGAKKNAVAWVQDAVVAGFSQFNLFKEPGKQEDTTAHQDHHCRS